MNALQTLYAKAEPQRPPKPELVWNPCSWCGGTGHLASDGTQCAMCRGEGGWWEIASETASLRWLAADALALIAAAAIYGWIAWFIVDRWAG